MKDRFSEDEVIATIARLTRSQLIRFIEVEFVRPEQAHGIYVFRSIDIARLELLCDLSQDLDLDETALGVVISLLDQLHAVRRDLAHVTGTIDSLPADLRAQIRSNLMTF